jgi:hypothetical protein
LRFRVCQTFSALFSSGHALSAWSQERFEKNDAKI